MLGIGTLVETSHWGIGKIIGHEMHKEKLSRYKLKFDHEVPWKDNIGYFQDHELKVVNP